jgi:hypothetical protein
MLEAAACVARELINGRTTLAAPAAAVDARNWRRDIDCIAKLFVT